MVTSYQSMREFSLKSFRYTVLCVNSNAIIIIKGSCYDIHVIIISLSLYSKSFHTEKYPSDDFILVNDHGLKAKFSGSTGLLKSLCVGSTELTVDLDFVSYGTVTSKEKSGAYLFLPDGEAKTILGSWSNPPITITVGPLVSSIIYICHLASLSPGSQIFNDALGVSVYD